MKKKIITTFLISASILGAMAITKPVKADSIKGIVTTKNMARLYNNDGKLISNRALAANTPWVTDQRVDLNSVGSVYRVATNEFVKASDVELQHGQASTGTVKVGSNGALVYNYDSGKYNAADNKLAKGSMWKYNRVDNINGKTWYQIATDMWINSDDATKYNGIEVENTGTATIAYAPDSGTDLWQGFGNDKVATGRKLANGTSWKFFDKVVDFNGDAWYEIGSDQWISGAFTKISNDKFTQSSAQVWDPNYAAVKADKKTAVYSDSNFNSATKNSIDASQIEQVVSTVLTGNTIWYEKSDGGWLPSTAVSEVSVKRSPVSLNGKTRSEVLDEVINVAKQQLGKPYVWNGKGPNNFDCSGLMQYVFRQVTGQNIGGWTVPQETAGTKVSLNQLERGDLVFWGNAGATYHVGLYLGNNQYLNALKPGTNVKIDSITNSFKPSFGVRIFY